MLFTALALFAIAAMLGLYLLSFILKNKNTPKKIAFTHGPVAILGLIILYVYALRYDPAPIISIVIFTFAALGGLMIIYKDLTGRPIPKGLAIGHGLTALVGFATLIYFIAMQ